MRMEEKKGFRKSQTMLCCVIAVLLVPAIFLCSRIINQELLFYIKNTLNEVSRQNVNSIKSQVKSDFLILEELSDRVRFDDSFESIMDGMRGASEAYGFKRMGVIYRDGIAHTSDDVQLDISDEDHIVRAFAGENVVSDIFPDDAGGKTIFVYTVPIFDRTGGQVDGVLFATCDTASIRTHFEASAFSGKGYSYIVKADGTLVIDSSHEAAYEGMQNVFTAMESVGKNREVSVQMQKDMAEGAADCLSFQNKGELRYINYAPLGINDWYLLSIVPADVTNGSRFRIMFVTYIVFALVTVVSLVFVMTMIKSERATQAELKRILYVDELTGGMSFVKFSLDAAARLAKKQDKNEKAACIMADLDNFRLINNLYGRTEGDKTIRKAYKVLENAVGENALITRRVADRFYAMVFFTEQSQLDHVLKSFVDGLKASSGVSENEYIINPSIGVYIIEKEGEEIETITNNATIAHDTIVSRGERIAYYNEAQRDRLKENKQLEDKMELAHKNQEFIPYFQPKYSATTGEICGAEALIRWKKPDGTITPPREFIPLAESNGFIRVLDRAIFNSVCALQRKILNGGGKCVPISVNVSRQLMYEQNFASDYIETIQKYKLSPDLVELEITESVLFDDDKVFRSIIDKLRENGFKILMDDFGTGYSSLMMLSSVPIDNLKLDKSFVDSFEEEKGRKIIISVIELAKSLSLPVTAEGVETRGQVEFLKNMGCNVIQGFYFSKPVPEEVFREMLLKG